MRPRSRSSSPLLFDGWFALWAWFFSLRRPRLSLASWGLRSPGLRILWLVPVTLVAVYVLNIIYEVAYQALAGIPDPRAGHRRHVPARSRRS